LTALQQQPLLLLALLQLVLQIQPPSIQHFLGFLRVMLGVGRWTPPCLVGVADPGGLESQLCPV